MNKAVLLSIKPQWCELIAMQRKTLEVRKSIPSIETPFKVYIYETKAKWLFDALRNAGMTSIAEILEDGFGKVVGEFTCDYIKEISVPYPAYFTEMDGSVLDQSCLTYYEIHSYAGTSNIYGWHISDLRVYAEPKTLSDFSLVSAGIKNGWYHKPVDRAPQSFCYVEELTNV